MEMCPVCASDVEQLYELSEEGVCKDCYNDIVADQIRKYRKMVSNLNYERIRLEDMVSNDEFNYAPISAIVRLEDSISFIREAIENMDLCFIKEDD